MTTEETKAKRPAGVWIARYPDNTGIVLFGREIEALRYATRYGMVVERVEYGVDIIAGPK